MYGILKTQTKEPWSTLFCSYIAFKRDKIGMPHDLEFEESSVGFLHFFEYDVKNKRNGMRKEALPGAQKLFILPWKIPRFMFSGKIFLFTNARNSLIFICDILDWFKIGFKKDFAKIAFILPFEQNWSYIIANFFLKYNPLFISYWPEVWLSYDK